MKLRVRPVLYILVAVFAGALLLIGALLVFLQTPPGHAVLKMVISWAIGKELVEDEHVAVGHLTGRLPFSVQLDTLSVYDAQGTLCEARDITGAWSPFELLRGRIHINWVKAEHLSFDRIFKTRKKPKKHEEHKPKNMPNLNIDKADFPDIAVGFLKQPGDRLAVHGSTTADGSPRVLKIDAELTSTVGTPLNASVNVAISAEPDTLGIHVAYTEGADGLLVRIAKLKTTQPVHIDVNAEGPLRAWKGTAAAQTGDAKFIDVTVTMEGEPEKDIRVDGQIEPPPGMLPPEFDPIFSTRNILRGEGRLDKSKTLDIKNLSVISDILEFTTAGTFNLDSKEMKLQPKLDVKDLSRLNTLAKTPLQGQASLSGPVSGTFEMPAGQLQLAANNVVVAGAHMDALRGPITVAFSAPVNSRVPKFTTQGDLAVENFAYEGVPELPDKNVHLVINVEGKEPSTIAVHEVRVENSALRATAQGAVDWRTRGVVLNADIATEQLAYFAGMTKFPMQGAAQINVVGQGALDQKTASGKVSGAFSGLSDLPEAMAAFTGKNVNVSGDITFGKDVPVTVSNVKISGGNAEVSGSGAYTIAGKKLDAGLQIVVPDLEALSDLAKQPLRGSCVVQAQGSGTLDDLVLTVSGAGSDLMVGALGKRAPDQGGGLDFSINGRVNVDARKAQGKFKAASGDIAPFTTAYLEGSGGSATLDADLAIDFGAPDYKARVGLEFDDLKGISEYGSALVGSKASIDAELALDRQAFVARNVRVRGKAARLDGDARYDTHGGAVDAKWQLDVADVAPLSGPTKHPMTGAVRINGQLKGPARTAQLTLEAKTKGLQVEGQSVSVTAAKLDARDLSDNPKGMLRLAVDWKKSKTAAGHILAQCDFAVKSPTLEVTGLRVQIPGVAANGALTADMAARTATGNLRGDAKDLSWLGAAINKPLGGSARFDLQLATDAKKQNATLSVDSDNVTTPWGTLERGQVKADLRDVLGGASGNVTVSAAGFKQNDLVLDSVKATGTGSLAKGEFNADAAGNHGGTFTFVTDGNWAYGESIALTLRTLQGRFGDIPVTLQSPLVAQKEGEQYSLGTATIRLGTGAITAGGRMGPAGADASLTVVSLPLELIHFFGGPDVSGSVDGAVRLDGAPEQPRLTAEISGKKLCVRGDRYASVPATDIAAKAALENGMLTARARLTGLFKKPIDANATAPVQVSLAPFAYRIEKEGPISGAANFSADLKEVNNLLAADQQRMEGEVDGNIVVSGTMNTPQIKGQIKTSGATYENYSTGTLLKNVRIEINGNGKRIEITSAEATDGGAGRVTASGWLDLDAAAGFPVDVTVDVQKATLVRRDDVTAGAGGKVRLAGALKNALAATGDIAIGSADIAIARRFSREQLTGLKVIDVNQPEDPKPDHQETARVSAKQKKDAGPPEDQSGMGALIALNINVNSPGQAFVRGYGLDSEWKGALLVAGTAAKPQISGHMSVVRGQMTFLGRVFRLTESSISFADADPPIPVLDITAEAKAADVTALVKLTGDIGAPQLTLESTPQLPQDEILSRVLFGRELARISPVQAIQIASAANALAGGPKALNLLDSTRTFLGVDQLTLVPSGEKAGETALGIGKYLGKNVHVNVQQGLGSTDTKAQVEIEVAPNLSVESSVSEKGEGIQFNWKKDY